MPRIAKELSALHVNRLNKPGHYSVGGVTGLYLYISPTGTKSWVMRILIAGKRRHMGLGAYPSVTLSQAREKARTARIQVEAGSDPIAARQEAMSLLKSQQLNAITFKDAANAYIESHGESWRNPKHRAQWISTLDTYAYPTIAKLLVSHVQQTHILTILEPIWRTKNETASRLRGRIETILDWATVRGYRQGDNPAQWKGRLDKLLPAPGKVQKVVHHKALAIDEVSRFMKQLANKEGLAARALEFAILTAARSGEVRGAKWNEIDQKNQVWVVPADRMKAHREHRVPLSHEALKLLKRLPSVENSEFVFPSPTGKALSDMALVSVIRRMEVDAVPHGFRSTFRDWVGEKTSYPRELAEQALAHTLENKVEAAYRRGDALEKRRILMQDWANFLYGNT